MASHGDDVHMSSSDGSSSDDGDCVPPNSKRIKVLASSMSTSSGVKDDPISTKENPVYDSNEQRKLYQKSRPFCPPKVNTQKHKLLTAFCNEVEIILQTVSDDEYQAAATLMKPPSEEFERAVVFPSAGTVVGLFADHKISLIQTDVGSNSSQYVDDAIGIFPNVHFIVAVGTCYAFDSLKFKLGDVLVSKKISDLKNLKFSAGCEVVDRGQTIDVNDSLKSVFCMDMVFEEDFVCSATGRVSRAYCGRYASHSSQLDDKEIRDKFLAAVPEAIGGDMEGGELLRFQQNRKIEGIIVIKGVAGYADGCGGKEWQFTAALAALKYTQSKLYFYQSQRNISGVSSLQPTIQHCGFTQTLSPALSRYSSYLKFYYSNHLIASDDRLSIAPSTQFISLALIKKRTEPGQDAFSRSTFYGGVDQILKSKTPLDMNDLLLSDSQFVLVEGPPGIGKSTLCWELCRKWDTLKSLQHFKIVLVLKLRERRVQTSAKLSEIFHHRDEELCQSVVEEVYRCEGEGVLLILDGFDEVPTSVVKDKSSLIMELLIGTCLPKAVRLVTSRPSALHHKRIFPQDHRHVEILGFTDEHKSEFANIAFQSEPVVIEHFKTFIFSNPIINSLMYIPVNCAIIAQVYKDIRRSRKLMPKTMTQLYTTLVLVLIRRHMIEKREWDEDSRIPGTLDDLPVEVLTVLEGVSGLAHRGLFAEEIQLVFTDEDVGKGFQHLGLLSETKEMYVCEGAKSSYSFLHLSIQEFLAAWYIAGNTTLLSSFLQLSHFETVAKFLAGLLQSCSSFPLTEWMNEHITLMLYCLYEAQDSCQSLKGHVAHTACDCRRYECANPLDLYVFGYVLMHVPIQWELIVWEYADLAQLVNNCQESMGSIINLSTGFSCLSKPDELPGGQLTYTTYTRVLGSLHTLEIRLPSMLENNFYLAIRFLPKLKTLSIFYDFDHGLSLDTIRKLSASLTRCTVKDVRIKYDCNSDNEPFLHHNLIQLSSLVKAALSCSTLQTLETDVPFIVFSGTVSPNLHTIKFDFIYDWTQHMLDCLCSIAHLCKMPSMRTLEVYDDCEDFPFLTSFLAILNQSLHCNFSFTTLILPWCISASMLSALKLHPNFLKNCSKSLSDLSHHYETLEDSRGYYWMTEGKCMSCPDLLEMQSIHHIHPLLRQVLYEDNTLF